MDNLMVFMTRLLVFTSATFSYRVSAWSVVARSSKTRPATGAVHGTTSSCYSAGGSTFWFSSHGCQNRRVNFDISNDFIYHPTSQSSIIRSTAILGRYATRLASSGSNWNQIDGLLEMENIYMEWTVEDDEFLYRHMNEEIPKIASKLGRGLRGVESRIAKLKDVNSSAYRRLFVEHKSTVHLEIDNDDNDDDDDDCKTRKLSPANEVMRRIKWDDLLNPDDFSVEYFDRMQETILSVAFGAKNDSVKGKEEMFVFAIPEHRITSIKYKERVVWDKKRRIDCVFGSMNGNGETIYKVLENYDQWKRRQDELEAYNKQRQRELVAEMKRILGEHLFTALKQISSELQSMAKIGTVTSLDIQNYVRDAMALFRKARTLELEESIETSNGIPQNDIEALHFLSSIVALLPDDDLRESILLQIYNQLNSMEPSKKGTSTQRGQFLSTLADINEDELIESFVRGSGAGGQKINKTANKVLLIHEPTQLRVECQDTRSLQQNRKIARKRLKLKLDEYLNGSDSVTQKKITQKINKKQKVKAKNKARLRKKKDALEQENGSDTEDDNDYKI